MKSLMRKRGVVFSLDAAIAVTVLIIVLINSAYYFSTSSKESLSQLQPVRLASDILAIFDYTGELNNIIVNDPLFSSFIDPASLNLSRYLPGNYEMKVAINDLQESNATAAARIGDEDPFQVCSIGQIRKECVISPGQYVNFTTLPIQTAGHYYFIIKTDQPNLPLVYNTLTVQVNNTVLPPGMFGQEQPVVLPYYDNPNTYIVGVVPPLYFNSGENIITIRLAPSYQGSSVKIDWFRVLGDDGYALELDKTLPNNRFVGTGERLVAATQGSTFYGFHNVRYWIWLKSST